MKPFGSLPFGKLYCSTLLLLAGHGAFGQINISLHTNTPYAQNFDALGTNDTGNVWTEGVTLPGWYASQSASPFAITSYRAGTGSDTAGALYSYGAAGTTERAMGSLCTGGPGAVAYGLRFTNNTTRAMSNIVVSYTGEQWRRVAGAGTQSLAFSYRAGAPTTTSDAAGTAYAWNIVPALDFASPNLGATGSLNGNASTNQQAVSSVLTGVVLLPGQELFLRWLDVDDSGTSDHGLGIDDLSISFTPVSFSDPAINAPPAGRTNAVHTTATFSVVASGLSTLSYQWLKGAAPLSNGGNISGATSNTLVLSQVVHADAGNYSVIVSNAGGVLTSSVAPLTVVGFAIAPVPPTNALGGQPVSVGLNFIDNQTSVNSASGTSGNPTVLPNANIAASASGSSGSATLTPVSGTGGVVLTTLAASDGTFATNTVFPLLVVPSTNVVFNDYFDYPDGPIVVGARGLWMHESGTVGDLAVAGSELQVSRSLSELAYAELTGGPYLTSGSDVLYSRFKVRFTTLPAAGGNYFAFFRDAAGSGRRARVWASTTNAAAGQFRLGVGNGSDSTATTAQVARDLDLNVTYTVVIKFVVGAATSSIWIDPTGEGDTGGSVFATAADVPATSADITSYGFRQAGSMGIMLVDDLVIGRTFASVNAPASPSPVQLNLSLAGNNAVLTWTDPTGLFKLATGTNLMGITNVVATVSPHTNAVSGQRYFRLVYP